MNDKLQKLKSLKKVRELSPVEQAAKKDVLTQLMGEMRGLMGDHLKGVKKVTVAADSKPGLSEGLEKAKELLGHGDEEGEESPELEHDEEMSHQDLDGDMEAGESPEHQAAVLGKHASLEMPPQDDESDDDIDAKIQELMLKKEMRKKAMV